MRLAAILLGALVCAGCYDLESLERGEEEGLRLVAATGAPPRVGTSFELTLRDTLGLDLQILVIAGAAIGQTFAPEIGEGWTYLRGANYCEAGKLVTYYRLARGEEDSRVHFELPELERVAVSSAAVRGVDPALPLGPIDIGVSNNGAVIKVSPKLRERQRTVGVAGFYNGLGSISVPGLAEVSANGHISVLYGDPLLAADGNVTFVPSSGAGGCVPLLLISVLPR